MPADIIRERAREFAQRLPETLAAAPEPRVRPEKDVGAEPAPETLTFDASEEQEFNSVLTEAGLTDGLPVVSPTKDRVERMLAYVERDTDSTIGPIPPVWRRLPLRSAAANAVMAGCWPEHFPVILQAFEAMLEEPEVNFYGMQTTTHPIGPMLLVSGPIADELGLSSGAGCLGPGPWSNGVLGRALRLICMNGGGAYPGGLDKATMGQPGKFSFCFAENQADSPWPSYRESLGFDSAVTTVTLVGAEAPTNINDHGSTDAEGILRTIAGTMATTGNNNMYWLGDTFVIVGPEHAATLAGDGYGRREVQEELHRLARVPVERMAAGQFAHIRSWIAEVEQPRFVDDDGKVALTRAPEDIHVVVAGGPGKHSMWVPTWFRSVTRPIADERGVSVTSIDDLRRKTAA
jgi:hypothetical protein